MKLLEQHGAEQYVTLPGGLLDSCLHSPSTTSTNRMSSQRVLVSALVLLLAMQAVIGQNYHFSNGWHAGKKRGGDINGCAFRRDVLMLVNKLILEEASRMSQCQGVAANLEFAESDSLDADADADNQLANKRWK